MAHRVSVLPLTLFALAFFSAGRSAGYPQYVAKGYTNCATCHYSPTGGGLLNSYGHASAQATFPDLIEVAALAALRSSLAKNDVTGFDNGHAAVQWDFGLDTRLLWLRTPQHVQASPESVVIPMLVEVGGILAVGSVSAYATWTPRRASAERAPNTVVSREHWLQYRASESGSLRAGRMVLPFGLRIPDHTQYTREDLGFNKWDQSYALEADIYTETWWLSVAGFAGDLWLDPPELQERGAVFSIGFNWPGRGGVGGSALAATSGTHRAEVKAPGAVAAGETVNRVAASLFLRTRLWGPTYVMAEAAGQRRSGNVETQNHLAGFLRAGWFPLESLDLYVELGGRAVLGYVALTKVRYLGGITWQVLPWLELSPAVLLEEDVETGLKTQALVQLHMVY